jgi:hypothetical protein
MRDYYDTLGHFMDFRDKKNMSLSRCSGQVEVRKNDIYNE